MSPRLRALLRSFALRAVMAQEWWQSGVTYNPLLPHVYHDPYPTYARLRAKDPVHWSPLMDSWVCSRYADVDAIMRDHKRFSSDPRLRQSRRVSRSTPPPGGAMGMVFLDPPDHTRLRALVNKAFTPQTINALGPRIRALVDRLLDDIPDPTHFDLVEALAAPLPVIVMAELLGVPPQDRAQFRRWSDQRARLLEPTITEAEVQVAGQAAEALDAYFLRIIAERRAAPREDLISSLVLVEEAGEKLTQAELLAMLRLLLIAGNETTTNFLGLGVLALLRHPEQMQRLRQEPALLDKAIEELLRYDTSVQLDARVALEDMDLGGRRVTAGQGVLLLLGAANRDPEVFPEPARLDLTRHNTAHLAFGRGIHHCLGAPLSRLESRIVFAALLERFADLQLHTPQPRFKDNVVLRGLQALPLRAVPVSR